MRVNRKASIRKHVRLADGKWRYCRPVPNAKGKIVSDMVMAKGREERHAEGTYCICFYNPKLTWQKCGPKPVDALAAAERQRALFKAMEHGIVERPKKSQTTGTIDEAVTAYLEELEAKVGNGSKRPQTHAASKQVLREFQAHCERKGKKNLSKITKARPAQLCGLGDPAEPHEISSHGEHEIHPREPVSQGNKRKRAKTPAFNMFLRVQTGHDWLTWVIGTSSEKRLSPDTIAH